MEAASRSHLQGVVVGGKVEYLRVDRAQARIGPEEVIWKGATRKLVGEQILRSVGNFVDWVIRGSMLGESADVGYVQNDTSRQLMLHAQAHLFGIELWRVQGERVADAEGAIQAACAR